MEQEFWITRKPEKPYEYGTRVIPLYDYANEFVVSWKLQQIQITERFYESILGSFNLTAEELRELCRFMKQLSLVYEQ